MWWTFQLFNGLNFSPPSGARRHGGGRAAGCGRLVMELEHVGQMWHIESLSSGYSPKSLLEFESTGFSGIIEKAVLLEQLLQSELLQTRIQR